MDALASAAGFMVPASALIAMPDGLPPALRVERFDIRTDANDQRLLAMEDLCSVLGFSPQAKYDGVARALRGLSTSPDEDLLILLSKCCLATLLNPLGGGGNAAWGRS